MISLTLVAIDSGRQEIGKLTGIYDQLIASHKDIDSANESIISNEKIYCPW